MSGGGAAAAATNSWTGPDAPAGAPKLDLVGPVQLSPGPYTLGDTLKASFTLRNDGGRAFSWSVVTLVARGPQDQERDLGSVYDVRLKPGEYRLFTGRVRLDLAGRWHGWLVAGNGQTLALVDGGAPFSFVVRAGGGAAGSTSTNTTPGGTRGGRQSFSSGHAIRMTP